MTQPQLGSFESIPLSAIRLSLTNPRKHFDETAMQELTRSIQSVGVNQPVLLRPVKIVLDDVLYELVTGERRYRASVAAEKEGIPAIIRELTDEQALEIQMIENLQRADLHPVEEAEGFRLLLAHGATPEDCARKSGKSLAHVLRIIKLLDLEVLAKQIYAEGHLSLDHALLLARLTAKDQERALCFLLKIGEHEIKKDRPAAVAIQAKLDRRKPPVLDPDEDEEENSWEREQYERRIKTRLVDATAPELKDWIRSNVLLQLNKASWMLHDTTLVPVAGACTDCPKRTGANVALFADMTTAEDTCTDPTCFSAKQAAQSKRLLDAAKESGAPLLKISEKTSHQKLEQQPVEVKKGATTVTKATVKQGQWVESEEGACEFTVQGLMQDGDEKGKLRFVCANQKCKVHKHKIDRPQSNTTRTSNGSWEQEQRRRKDEAELTEKVVAQMMDDVASDRVVIRTSDYLAMLLSMVIADDLHSPASANICAKLGIEFVMPKKSANAWEQRSAIEKSAQPKLVAWLEDADQDALQEFAFHVIADDAMSVDEWNAKDKLALAHSIVERAGLDAKALEREVRKDLERSPENVTESSGEVEKKPEKSAKKAAKKSAKKAGTR